MSNKFSNKKLRNLIIIAVTLSIFAPFLLTRQYFIKELNFTETGQIGDTIGGITAPILNLISIILLYFSFNEQFKANKKQTEIIIEERLKNQLQKNFKLTIDFFNHFKSESERIPIDKIFHNFNSENIESVKIENVIYDVNVIKQILIIGKSILIKIRTMDLLEDDKNYIITIVNHYFMYKYNTILHNVTKSDGRCEVCGNIHFIPKILENTVNDLKDELNRFKTT